MPRSRLSREVSKGHKALTPKRKSPQGSVTIETIKTQVSIEDVVEHIGGSCPHMGTGWSRCRCPFHEDRTPSASVHSLDGRFQCFSCDFSGDVIDLAQKHLNLQPTQIQEALAWLTANFLDTSP